jgi:hypothetical protein
MGCDAITIACGVASNGERLDNEKLFSGVVVNDASRSPGWWFLDVRLGGLREVDKETIVAAWCGILWRVCERNGGYVEAGASRTMVVVGGLNSTDLRLRVVPVG